MPLFRFKCPVCGKEVTRILPATPEEGTIRCPNDDTPLKRNLGGPSTQVKETIDNGIMGKAVERWTDTEELFYAHSKVKTKE